ncbi:hypothetical protein JCM6882_002631 [Rhodosporidiobolus microsporus]
MASIQTVDDLVALISATPPEEVDKSLIPALRRLDKAAEASSSRSTSGRAQRGAAGAAAEGSSTSAGGGGAAAAGASTSSAPAAPAGHLLEGMMSGGQDPLDVLSPYQHTVGYLYILNTRLNATNPNLNVLMPKVQGFVEQFDAEEARKLGEQVSYLASQLCSIGDAIKQPALPVNALKTLVQRYPLRGHLTQFHTLFLQVIMISGAYTAAAEVLAEDITDVNKQLFPIKYQDHLLYHYLGGTIMALLGDYVRAADLLEIAVSAPGSAASMIQIDAYKKLVLVQLLAYGKVQPLPKYTTSSLQQAVKVLCVPYADYAAAFATLDRTRVAQARDKGREVFEADLNFGLIALCDESFRRRQIQNLTETYLTQSLGEITAAVGLDPADEKQVEIVEEEVRGMIASKQIFATLTPPPTGSGTSKAHTTVTFSDDPEPYISHETVERVTRAIREAQELERRWAEEGRRLGESKEFVQKAWSAAANGPGAAVAFGGFSAPGFSDDLDYGSTPGGIPGSWGAGDDIDVDSD